MKAVTSLTIPAITSFVPLIIAFILTCCKSKNKRDLTNNNDEDSSNDTSTASKSRGCFETAICSRHRYTGRIITAKSPSLPLTHVDINHDPLRNITNSNKVGNSLSTVEASGLGLDRREGVRKQEDEVSGKYECRIHPLAFASVMGLASGSALGSALIDLFHESVTQFSNYYASNIETRAYVSATSSLLVGWLAASARSKLTLCALRRGLRCKKSCKGSEYAAEMNPATTPVTSRRPTSAGTFAGSPWPSFHPHSGATSLPLTPQFTKERSLSALPFTNADIPSSAGEDGTRPRDEYDDKLAKKEAKKSKQIFAIDLGRRALDADLRMTHSSKSSFWTVLLVSILFMALPLGFQCGVCWVTSPRLSHSISLTFLLHYIHGNLLYQATVLHINERRRRIWGVAFAIFLCYPIAMSLAIPLRLMRKHWAIGMFIGMLSGGYLFASVELLVAALRYDTLDRCVVSCAIIGIASAMLARLAASFTDIPQSWTDTMMM